MERNRILMVEDELGIALPLKDFFEDNGLEVFHTDNGEEALSLFGTLSPNLLLLDVIVPGKNGFEVISEIRKKNTEIPVILMTGSELAPESEIKGYKLGAINYIKKPVLPDALLALIKNLLLLPEDLKKYKVGGYTIIFHNTYMEIEDRKIKLRDKDTLILLKLLEKKGTVVKRSELLRAAWEDDNYFYHNRLDGSIKRLRETLKDFGNIGIRSLYGQGYLMEEMNNSNPKE